MTRFYRTMTLMLASATMLSTAAAQTVSFGSKSPVVMADSSSKPAAAKPDSAPKPEFKPSWNFSAWLFGAYSYQTDSAAKASNGQHPTSKFSVDRAYLTFKGQVAPDFGFRVTTDVKTLPANNTVYNGLIVRLKYAYMQWDYLHASEPNGLSAWARIGQIHTVVVDYEENFWPRWLQKTAIEYWAIQPSSADQGASTQFNLPGKWGQAYVTVGNGGGYETAVDGDRFKDAALRFSLTPLAKSTGLLKSLTVTPWFQVGRTQGAATNHPGLENNAGGIFIGNNDARLTFGADYAKRQVQTIPTTTTVTTTAELYDGFVQVRPMLFSDPKGVPWGVIVRYDRFKANTANSANRTLLLAGVFIDVAKSSSFGLSYQDDQGHSATTLAPEKSIWQLNWQVTF
jgi:hypothetical protein